jgi:hypothetical protein
MRRRPVALAAIKAVHTLAWFSIESSIVYLLNAGLRRQSDRRAAVAGAVALPTSSFADGSPTTFPQIHVPLLCSRRAFTWGIPA